MNPKPMSTGKLYFYWFGLVILALVSMVALFPMVVSLLVALLIHRGEHQRAALDHMLVELKELPNGISRVVDIEEGVKENK
jgi:hypothetical protein